MRKEFGIPLAAAAAAIAGITAFALPVSAASVAPDSVTSLSNLTMTKSGSENRQVTLQCDPTGGTHPTPDDACTKLTAVNGQFGLLQPVPLVTCPTYYAPVTVTVTGYWKFQPVNFTRTYINDCDASVSSNYVFRF